MTLDRIGEIETLQAIAETGSFSKAADRLGISQSSVSRRVAVLEARLEHRKLISRTTRVVHLTEAGRSYLNLAREALDKIYLAEQLWLEREQETQGTVRMSLPPAIGKAVFLPMIDDLLREYPGLKLELNFSERYVDFVQDQIDLAVRVRRTPQTGIEEAALGKTRLIFVASRSYAKALGRSRKQQIQQARMIAPSLGHARDFERLLRRIGIGEDQVQAYVDDVTAVADLVKCGHGVGFVPKIVMHESLKQGQVVELDFEVPTPTFNIYASYPGELRDSRRVKLVLSRMKQAIAELT